MTHFRDFVKVKKKASLQKTEYINCLPTLFIGFGKNPQNLSMLRPASKKKKNGCSKPTGAWSNVEATSQNRVEWRNILCQIPYKTKSKEIPITKQKKTSKFQIPYTKSVKNPSNSSQKAIQKSLQHLTKAIQKSCLMHQQYHHFILESHPLHLSHDVDSWRLE